MMDGPLIFVDIDTQRDFLDPAGALYVPGSEAIVPNLARLTEYARSRGIPILATACAHEEGDAEFAVFPPHCLVGTPGQGRVEATAWPGGEVVGRDDREPGTIRPHLTVEKRFYDVFTHPEADRIVALYGRDHPMFVVYGVATDYCVKAAVLGLLERGQKVAVVVDAIRAVDAAREGDELSSFAERGALLTLTEVVCGQDETRMVRTEAAGV